MEEYFKMWWKDSDDERFWIYLAGFIDGEGCFGIFKSKRKDAREALRPYIAISNTNKEIIDLFMNTIPQKVYKSVGKRRQKEHHKIQYNLRIENFESVLFVTNKVFKYLIIKREVAKLVRDFIIFRKLKCKNNHCYRHLGKEEYSIYDRIKELNHRKTKDE